MILIENVEIFGWEAAIRGMRNAKNSWDKSDSMYGTICNEVVLGPNDHGLMTRLAKAGTDHAKFRRMINVTVDIVAPMYWWKEFDTYKVGTVSLSCSTMHKIAEKEFTLDDFSHEHLRGWEVSTLENVIAHLNDNRRAFNKTGDKDYWWQMIQLLPSSYNQRRTIQLNYEVLRNMYHARRNHKLDEWHTFCDWVECLPYSGLITLKGGQRYEGQI